VPERKQAYTLRVFFFVEYESDVEEERGRAREFLQKLRIPAEVLVLWLTSGHLPTYEVIINGQNPGLDAEKEVEECLKNQDWWEEIQKMRGKQREDAGSNDDGSSNKDVFESDESDDTSQGRQSTAREGDIDEYESDSSPRLSTPTKITRRSHGDSLRGPPPPKSVGQKEPKIPVPPRNLPDAAPSIKVSASDNSNAAKTADPCPRPQSSESIASNTASISSTSNKLISNSECQLRSNEAPLSSRDIAPQGVDEPFSALKNQARPATPPQRPAISRHSSMPKFSSKPVPITIVTTEDEPGPSIMFSDTPSPPPRHSRIPSTYRPRDGRSSFPDHISEASEGEHHQSNPPTLSRRSSSYSTQASPLSFNDLPCRAQHLILNELIRQHSDDTAVMFTTLPSPVAGTSKSEGASVAYLSDLEVLCYGCPPCLLVHSNSMTVTISL
jgi:potassium/chloride transporter 9